MSNSLHRRVQSLFGGLSPAKQKAAGYLTDHWQDVCFLSAAQLGAKIGVSESVVIRLTKDLGYGGYPELQEELRGLVERRLTLIGRLDETSHGQSEPDALAVRALELDIANVRAVLVDNPLDALSKAVDMMAQARRIGVAGYGPTSSLAVYLAMNLDQILNNAEHLSPGIGGWHNRARQYRSGDLVVAMTFPRYHQSPYEILEVAKTRGATALAITDSMIAPIASLADHTLTVRIAGASFNRSLTAGMALINMLLAMLASREEDRVRASLADLDGLLKRY